MSYKNCMSFGLHVGGFTNSFNRCNNGLPSLTDNAARLVKKKIWEKLFSEKL